MMPTKELTNDLIKSVATDAMVDRGYCSDIDTLVKPGVYTLNSDTQNLPSGASFQYGIAEVSTRYTDIFQRITAYQGSAIAVRIGKPGDWKPWNFYRPTTT